MARTIALLVTAALLVGCGSLRAVCVTEMGRCTWTIAGDTLTLVPVEPDACTGRAASLAGVTYTLFQSLA